MCSRPIGWPDGSDTRGREEGLDSTRELNSKDQSSDAPMIRRRGYLRECTERKALDERAAAVVRLGGQVRRLRKRGKTGRFGMLPIRSGRVRGRILMSMSRWSCPVSAVVVAPRTSSGLPSTQVESQGRDRSSLTVIEILPLGLPLGRPLRSAFLEGLIPEHARGEDQ